MNNEPKISYKEISILAEKLLKTSITHYDETCDKYFPMSQKDQETVHFSEELISIHQHPIYRKLDEYKKIRLSQLELINFFSLTIHGEDFLIKNMTAYLTLIDDEIVRKYLKLFIDEEHHHSFWFQKFCDSTPHSFDKNHNFSLDQRSSGTNSHKDFLIFLIKVYLFEQLSMIYNKILSKDPTLPPLIRSINQQHLIEEGRHVLFGITMIEHLYKNLIPIYPSLVEELSFQTRSFGQILFHNFFNQDIYKKCQLDQPFKVKKELSSHAKYHDWFNLLLKKSSRELIKRNIIQL